MHADERVIYTNIIWIEPFFGHLDLFNGHTIFNRVDRDQAILRSVNMVIQIFEPVSWILLDNECFLLGPNLCFMRYFT